MMYTRDFLIESRSLLPTTTIYYRIWFGNRSLQMASQKLNQRVVVAVLDEEGGIYLMCVAILFLLRFY